MGEISLTMLVRQSLRMRPDRLVVGEAIGTEVRELMAAINTGHQGGCGTVHANAPAAVPARFEALGALTGMSPAAVRIQLRSALRVVIHLERLAAGHVVHSIGLIEGDHHGLRVTTAWQAGVEGPGWADLRMLAGLSSSDLAPVALLLMPRPGAWHSLPGRLSSPIRLGPTSRARCALRRLDGDSWRRSDPGAECLMVLDAMVSVLRSGAAATTELRLAVIPLAYGEGHTVAGWRTLRETALADGADGDVVAAWHELGVRWRSDSLANIAAAWQMSQRHGRPLADAMAGSVANVRARRRFSALRSTRRWPARATMGVLLLLPLLGIALGYLLGVDMLGRYRGASGLVTFWPGLVLLWCGWGVGAPDDGVRSPRSTNGDGVMAGLPPASRPWHSWCLAIATWPPGARSPEGQR